MVIIFPKVKHHEVLAAAAAAVVTDLLIETIINVTPKQEINYIIGSGNTIFGELIGLKGLSGKKEENAVNSYYGKGADSPGTL